jgi:hypothetical protein
MVWDFLSWYQPTGIMSTSTTVRYGLIAGILMSLVLFLPYFLWGKKFDFNLGEALAYSAIFLSLAGSILLGIRSRRKKEFEGTIPFKIAFRTGMTITISAAIFVYFSVYLFLEFKGTEWLSSYYEHKVLQLHEKFPDKAVFEEKLATLNNDFAQNSADYLNVNSQALMIFFIVLLFGAVISLASAAIQQRD